MAMLFVIFRVGGVRVKVIIFIRLVFFFFLGVLAFVWLILWFLGFFGRKGVGGGEGVGIW